jgi:hypothetical protein
MDIITNWYFWGYIILTYLIALIISILRIYEIKNQKEQFEVEKYIWSLFLAFAPITVPLSTINYIWRGIKGEGW